MFRRAVGRSRWPTLVLRPDRHEVGRGQALDPLRLVAHPVDATAMTCGRSRSMRGIGAVGRREVPMAGLADDPPAAVRLQRVVVGADAPKGGHLGWSAVLDGDDMVDLQELAVGAAP